MQEKITLYYKTEQHDTTEILLKVKLNAITLTTLKSYLHLYKNSLYSPPKTSREP